MNAIFLAILAFCLISASALEVFPRGHNGAFGIVSPTRRCGGLGTPVQLRISECDGTCAFFPGNRYDCEMDFFSAVAAPSLSLRVQVCILVGFCTLILDVEIEGSSVQPGNLYTARYSIVPNDILSGQTLNFKAVIYHTDNELEEICVEAPVVIL